MSPAIAHGVELPTLPPGSMAADVAALLEMYFDTQDVPLPARRLMMRAALLRADWMAGEVRCCERHPPEHRHGTPERIAADASRRAMVALIEAARELVARPARH